MGSLLILKSRRFRMALAGILLLVVLPPLAYRFMWYPNTMRGRFDRVQIGMTEQEVKGILGEPGIFWTQDYPGTPISLEVWFLENGELKHESIDPRSPLPNWLKNKDIFLDPIVWSFDNARIAVEVNERGVVRAKGWAAHHQPAFWEQLREWLPFP